MSSSSLQHLIDEARALAGDGACAADQWQPVTIYGNGAEQHDLFGLEESV